MISVIIKSFIQELHMELRFVLRSPERVLWTEEGVVGAPPTYIGKDANFEVCIEVT